jgi:hypothetical protein
VAIAHHHHSGFFPARIGGNIRKMPPNVALTLALELAWNGVAASARPTGLRKHTAGVDNAIGLHQKLAFGAFHQKLKGAFGPQGVPSQFVAAQAVSADGSYTVLGQNI